MKRRSLALRVDADIVDEASAIAQKCRPAAMDALIYATARCYNAELVTLDSDFSGLPKAALV